MKLHDWLATSLRLPIYAGTGRLTPFAMEADHERQASVMNAINRVALRKLNPEDVHVRGMNAANNVIDYYESRFTEKGLRQAAKIYAGTAMAAGHDMTRTPLATVFAGEYVAHEQGERTRELRDLSMASWLRGLFYTSRKLSWADDLAEAIDAGIQREVSLHWYFTDARCGICEEDIRECEHFPGEMYEGRKCWYEMEGVTDIIETSFVIKGGQRGTSLWQPEGMQQAMAFGRAIRELKSDRQAFSEWRNKIKAAGPSPAGTGTSRSNGAARWLGAGLRSGV